MPTSVTLNNVEIEIPDGEHSDYFIQEGKKTLIAVDMVGICTALQTNQIVFDQIKDDLYLLSRWVFEAPRKRYYRDLILTEKIQVVSLEEFFLTEEGIEIIKGLEKCGHTATAILKAYNVEPMTNIDNSGPNLVPAEQLLKERN